MRVTFGCLRCILHGSLLLGIGHKGVVFVAGWRVLWAPIWSGAPAQVDACVGCNIYGD